MGFRQSHVLSLDEHTWVRQNVLRLRLAHGPRERNAVAVPRGEGQLDELSLARLALLLDVSPRELATRPEDLAARLREKLSHAAQLAGAEAEEDACTQAEAAWQEALRLAFPLFAGQAADFLARQALRARRPLDAITWVLRALTTPLGADAAHRSDMVSRLGAALMLTERYDVANAVLCSVADRHSPADSQVLIAHAASLLLQGRFDESVQAYSRVLEASGNLAPRAEAQAWIGYGAALGLVGNVSGALTASLRVDEIRQRELMPDLLTGLNANELWCAALAAPWRDARRLILEVLHDTHDPFARANLYDTLVFVLCRGRDWPAVWSTCTEGLAILRQGGGGSRMLKARFLWARAVAARHLGRDGALQDREWAEDLFDLVGSRGHLSALPLWPDDPRSAGAASLLDGPDDALDLCQGVVRCESEPHRARPPLGFEP
ncbi:MAG: hypothetical protein M0Z54_16760 [Thermaerobacter sp.]|nr:hypothetical protein [Thermaerobacter sp.]